MSELVGVALDLAPGPGLSGALPARWPQGQVAWPTGGVVRLGPVELAVSTTTLGSGRRAEMVLRNPRAGRPVALGALRLALGARPRRVLEHGWQSWSPVARRVVGQAVPARRVAPPWVRSVYHAAPELAGRALCGDQFLLAAEGFGDKGSAGGLVGFLDGRRHLSTVVAAPGELWAAALLDGVVLGPGEERPLDPLWWASGDPGALYGEYVDHWAAESGARSGGPSRLGWCSWYQYFWKLRPADLRANLARAAAHGVSLFQVDDGYQREVGDWGEPAAAFGPGDLGDLAARIGAEGMQGGIWTAPFLAGTRSALARDHPEWLAQDVRGRPLRAMWNPLAWKGWALALDTTHPGALDHLRDTFGTLRAQGWGYHKIDFCYAGALVARRHQGHVMTRAQALRAGLQAVREGIGEDAVLVGCGIPLAQGVGMVDGARVSPDTGPAWRPGLARLPGYPDLAPAASSVIPADVLRAPLHRRLWVNDPDCLLLRPRGSRLSPGQREILAAVIAGTGGLTVLSDDLACYGPAQWEAVARLARLAPVADSLLRIPDPFAPVVEVHGTGGLRLSVSWEGPFGEPPLGPAPGSVPGNGAAGNGRRRVLFQGGRMGRGPWARLDAPAP